MVCAEINGILATTGLFIGGVLWYVNVVNKSVHRGFFYFFLPQSLNDCLPIFNYTNRVLQQLLLVAFFSNSVHGFVEALSSTLIQQFLFLSDCHSFSRIVRMINFTYATSFHSLWLCLLLEEQRTTLVISSLHPSPTSRWWTRYKMNVPRWLVATGAPVTTAPTNKPRHGNGKLMVAWIRTHKFDLRISPSEFTDPGPAVSSATFHLAHL